MVGEAGEAREAGEVREVREVGELTRVGFYKSRKLLIKFSITERGLVVSGFEVRLKWTKNRQVQNTYP